MEIVLCIVGDRSRDLEIRERLAAMGIPISKSTCEQVDFTRKPASEIPQLKWFDRRVDRQIEAAKIQNPTYAYVDWEWDNHQGFNNPPDLRSIYKLKEFVDLTRERLGVPVASWNLPGIKGKFPSTTGSSQITAEAAAIIAQPDFFIVNGYIRSLVGDQRLDGVAFANRLHDNINYARSIAGDKPVMVAWQGRLRAAEAGDLDPATVFAWWQTVATSGVDRVLWYFRTGDDGEQTTARLAEAWWQAPIMLGAINSTETE